MKTILKTLVGSRAHGLHTPESDWDYRGCFIVPTSEILSLGYKEKATSWLEGQGEDATAYELHHFLNLACHSNPSILEVLVSPVVEETIEGRALTELFPHLWNSQDAKNAFLGYSNNQRKKFLEDKDGRQWKFAVAYVRTLLLGIELLTFGTMTVNVEAQESVLEPLDLYQPPLEEDEDTPTSECLKLMKLGQVWSKGLVVDWAEALSESLKQAFDKNPDKKTDLVKVNQFLLDTRRANW